MSQTIINGDSAEVLKTIDSNTIDAVITDPPYGIEFLGKEWDSNTGAIEIWRECFRVLKPGGHLLAFSAARTYHNLATNVESVGFEIRDQIMWIYASGFPKAQDIGKSIQRRQGVERHEVRDVTDGYNIKNQRSFSENNDVPFERMKPIAVPTSPEAVKWQGWKTALKPAHEPIVMARKPMRGSTIDNVLEHGVGALNIDATRVAYQDQADVAEYLNNKRGPMERGTGVAGEQIGMFDTGTGFRQIKRAVTAGEDLPAEGRYPSNVVGEVQGYQKYFYCPKVSRRERHRGFEQDPISHPEMVEQMGGHYLADAMVWLPHLGKIYTHGLKHEYEQWCKKNDRDPLAQIATGDNFGDGLASGRKLHKTRDEPLAHIPTSKGGMLDKPTDGSEWVLSQHRDEKTRTQANVGNNHPTVKPVALMRYLVKLVTPQDSHIIDPFAGSGSTGMACRELGRQFTGIDLDEGYCRIARKRIAATQEDKSETLFE
jgi:site-specific DNA-methyltransferase (adenine-specific)